ncbi:hypothetical protein LCGC14_1065090 [marine sediment metagenome]|uniref:Uncharacterized protein n=1 Tax=marine sediment metagenome TaxID=412755 RepID=A0A0F9MPN4_9ZZZZ
MPTRAELDHIAQHSAAVAGDHTGQISGTATALAAIATAAQADNSSARDWVTNVLAQVGDPAFSARMQTQLARTDTKRRVPALVHAALEG